MSCFNRYLKGTPSELHEKKIELTVCRSDKLTTHQADIFLHTVS